MKKKANAKPRLAVARETVRQLTPNDLPRVIGGGTEPDVTRTTTSSTCPEIILE